MTEEEKEEHVAVREDGEYDMFKLIKLVNASADVKEEFIPYSDIKHFLRKPMWETEKGESISPGDILNNRKSDKDHEDRIKNADKKYPLLVRGNPYFWD